MLELDTGVARAGLPIMGIHMRVASKSKIQWIPATLHNSGRMDHCKVYHGSVEGISVLDPVDVEEAYSHIPSRHHSIQQHVWSHGRFNASFGPEEDSVERRLFLRHEVSSTEAVQILCWSASFHGYVSHFGTYPRSFSEVAIVQKVGQGNGYLSWGCNILYYPIPRGLSEVWGEWILCQTSTGAGH